VGDRAGDIAVDHQHARRQLARVRVDPGVEVEDRVVSLEMDAARDDPVTDVQEGEAQLAIGPEELEESANEDSALFPTGGRREQPVGAPALLVEDDERLEVGERIRRLDEADVPDRLGAPHLAPDLVTFLFAERREEAVHVDAHGDRRDRADVLAFDIERPAIRHLDGT
jgi:hypothetical protein